MLLAKILLGACLAAQATPSDQYKLQVEALRVKGMRELGAFSLLDELVTGIGPRMSGSKGAENAVAWGEATANRLGFQKVRLVKCMVPHWERGGESIAIEGGATLTGCALGGSVGTPTGGIVAEVVEVGSIDEAKALGDRARGKIVFYNGPFDPTLIDTFGQYGKAVGQRVTGASTAAKGGAVAVLVRSMTSDLDDVPHTGVLQYEDGVAKIPAAALGLISANRLSTMLKLGPVRVKLTLGCKINPDVESASVISEITGSEHPEEVIVMGGHLDSWDKGRGAHDDGTGVVHALEALRLIKELGWKPKRTIRVVLFMDEEQKGRGAEAYKEFAVASKQKHIAGIESDRGGFAPRGFTTSLSTNQIAQVRSWQTALAPFGIEWIRPGGGGADVSPLIALGTKVFGFVPDSQRYFDYHHSDKDTLDKVNPREVELGALSLALLAWMISEEGLPKEQKL